MGTRSRLSGFYLFYFFFILSLYQLIGHSILVRLFFFFSENFVGIAFSKITSNSLIKSDGFFFPSLGFLKEVFEARI